MNRQRNIRYSIGFEAKETTGFFSIANKDAAIAITNKLTGSQFRLWHYLLMTNPFSDRSASGEKIYRPIPTPADIAAKIGSSVDRVIKDMRVLKRLELYDYRVIAWEGHNRTAEKVKDETARLKKQKKEEGLNSLSDSKLAKTAVAQKELETLSVKEEGLFSPSTTNFNKTFFEDKTNETITGKEKGLFSPFWQNSETFAQKEEGLFSPPSGLFSPPSGLFSPPSGLFSPSKILEPLPGNDPGNSHTLQTNINTFHTSPLTPQGELREGLFAPPSNTPQKKAEDLEEEEMRKSNPRELGTNPRSLGTNPRSKPVDIAPVEKTTVIEENKCSAAEIQNISIVVRQSDGIFGKPRISRQELVNPYPDGEWMQNGRLDPNFVEWLAKDWMRSDATKFCNIHKAKADVRSYFANQPEKLPIRWQQYHEETLSRYENTSNRISAGIPIASEEQKMLVDRARAVATPIEELNERTQLPQIEPHQILSLEPSQPQEITITTSALPVTDSEPKKQAATVNIPNDPKDGFAENPEAYKVFDRSSFEIKNQASPEEIKNFFANRFKKVQEGMSMPKATKVNPETELGQIQADLSDNLLRNDPSVQLRARKFAQSYKCDVVTNEDGVICCLELDF